MSTLTFVCFMDYKDGKMARMETTEDMEIPVNIFIDNASEFEDLQRETPCSIDIYGVGSNIEVFPSEEAYEASGLQMAPISMIPMGTFPVNDDPDFMESPHILCSGMVTEVENMPPSNPGDPNYCLTIETLEFEFHLYALLDKPVAAGYIIHGVAWLFGDIVPLK